MKKNAHRLHFFILLKQISNIISNGETSLTTISHDYMFTRIV